MTFGAGPCPHPILHPYGVHTTQMFPSRPAKFPAAANECLSCSELIVEANSWPCWNIGLDEVPRDGNVINAFV